MSYSIVCTVVDDDDDDDGYAGGGGGRVAYKLMDVLVTGGAVVVVVVEVELYSFFGSENRFINCEILCNIHHYQLSAKHHYNQPDKQHV